MGLTEVAHRRSRRRPDTCRLEWLSSMLVQPVLNALDGARRVLVAGCGGGYDVLGAVPHVAELVATGRDVHVASMSFTYLNGLDGAVQSATHPNLYSVPGEAATGRSYCP